MIKTAKAISIILFGIMFWFFLMNISSQPIKSPSEFSNIGIENTFKLCEILQQSTLVTECKTDGWNMRVNLYANYSVFQADLACKQLQMAMVQNPSAWHFQGYKLQIFSPFSGDHPITICALPD